MAKTKLIRLDSYITTHGGFDVWYDPRRDVVIQSGQDDLGHRFAEETPALEFAADLQDEDGGEFLAALVESLRQNRPESMVQWGIALEAWQQARQRGDMSRLCGQHKRSDL